MATAYDNPFENQATSSHTVAIEADDGSKPDLATSGPSTQGVSGSIGSAPSRGPTETIGGMQTRRINNFDPEALDEPVLTTILRDLRNIWDKVLLVLYPKGESQVLKEWDLWGPLVLCLGLAMYVNYPSLPNS